MGTDCHTASLFPGTAAVQDKKSLVIGHYVPQVKMNRITLGRKVLNLGKNIIFLVSGSDKINALNIVRSGPYCPSLVPAQVIRPIVGKVTWYILE